MITLLRTKQVTFEVGDDYLRGKLLCEWQLTLAKCTISMCHAADLAREQTKDITTSSTADVKQVTGIKVWKNSADGSFKKK